MRLNIVVIWAERMTPVRMTPVRMTEVRAGDHKGREQPKCAQMRVAKPASALLRVICAHFGQVSRQRMRISVRWSHFGQVSTQR
ncbi:MAG: hypothetical protein WBG36_00735 [Ornithinimicrobium sp.]